MMISNFSHLISIAALTISFFVTVVLGRILIPVLHRMKFGQTILQIGPSWHKKKQGTPTMGGITFILGILSAVIPCIMLFYNVCGFETTFMQIKLWSGLIMAVLFGIIGFIDDYIKIAKKQNKGLSASEKLLLQFSAAGIYLLTIFRANSIYGITNGTQISFPFFGYIDLGWFYWIFSAIIIVGIVNAVNLNDGIDGLCGSITFFVGIFFFLIANILNMSGLAIQCSSLIGAMLGFLVWNYHPAKVFMGDTGSLFLGGMICAIGYTTGLHVILIILAGIYICEMLSVILQVVYFKISGGKRIFKMTPIHHHFEMIGWSETKLCVYFSAFTIICGIISVLLVMFVY